MFSGEIAVESAHNIKDSFRTFVPDFQYLITGFEAKCIVSVIFYDVVNNVNVLIEVFYPAALEVI